MSRLPGHSHVLPQSAVNPTPLWANLLRANVLGTGVALGLWGLVVVLLTHLGVIRSPGGLVVAALVALYLGQGFQAVRAAVFTDSLAQFQPRARSLEVVVALMGLVTLFLAKDAFGHLPPGVPIPQIVGLGLLPVLCSLLLTDQGRRTYSTSWPAWVEVEHLAQSLGAGLVIVCLAAMTRL